MLVNHPKDVFLLIQGRSKVEHLHIVKKALSSGIAGIETGN